MSAAGQKVWIIQFIKITDNGPSRPAAIPCSSYETLKKHVCDLIANRLSVFDPRFRESLILLLESKNYDKTIEVWRTAQLHNTTPIGFDMWWDESPEVCL